MEVPGKASTICQPCSSTGEQIPAKSFCEDCNEYLCHGCCNDHRKFAVLRHHKLTDASAIDTDAQQQQQQQRGCKPTTTCKIHVDKLVEFYCRDHNVTVCGACAIVDHISCKPEYIPDVSKHYKDSDKYRAVRDELDNLLIKTRSLRETTEKNIELTKENNERTVEEIMESKEELINNVNTKCENRISETYSMLEEDTVTLNETKDNLTMVETELLEMQSYLDTLETQNSDLFIAGTNVTSKSEEFWSRLRNLEGMSNVYSYTFDRKLLGPISRLSPSEETGSTADNEEDTELSIESTTSIDWYSCYLTRQLDLDIVDSTINDKCIFTSMFILDSNRRTLLLADYAGKKLKTFDVNAKTEMDCLPLSSGPWQMSKLSNCALFAVTLPDEGKIKVIATSECDTMCVQRTISVDGACRGLCSTASGDLAVSFSEPVKLQIINLEGDVKYSLLHCNLPDLLLQYPSYLVSEYIGGQEFVFLADSDRNLILRIPITRAPTHMLVYTDMFLRGPRCITKTGDGHLLISCRASGAVQLVSHDGKKVRELLIFSGRNDPQSIYYDIQTKTLYISIYQSSEVRVYQLQ